MREVFIVGLIVFGGIGLYVRHQFSKVQKAAINQKGTYVAPPLPDSSRLKCMMCAGTGRTNFFSGRSLERVSCGSCRGTGWVDNPAYVTMRRASKPPSAKPR